MDNSEIVHCGKDVFIADSCIFGGLKSKTGPISFGDYCSILENCRFYVNENGGFVMGDNGIIHNNSLIQSYKPCKIGHNAWIGQNSIINATDKLQIGNNFAVGTDSKIWTHVFHGELLQGCKIAMGIPDYKSKSGQVIIGDDFWGIGQITISPGITIGNKVIVLTNSLVTKDIPDNTIVGGIPAKPIKVEGDLKGFRELSVIEKFELMKNFAQEFSKLKNVQINIDESVKKIVLGQNEVIIHCSIQNREFNDASYFDIIKRTYTKKHNKLEREFINFTIGYRARFIPE